MTGVVDALVEALPVQQLAVDARSPSRRSPGARPAGQVRGPLEPDAALRRRRPWAGGSAQRSTPAAPMYSVRFEARGSERQGGPTRPRGPWRSGTGSVRSPGFRRRRSRRSDGAGLADGPVQRLELRPAGPRASSTGPSSRVSVMRLSPRRPGVVQVTPGRTPVSCPGRAPVAQWTRASVFGTECRGFESLRHASSRRRAARRTACHAHPHRRRQRVHRRPPCLAAPGERPPPVLMSRDARGSPTVPGAPVVAADLLDPRRWRRRWTTSTSPTTWRTRWPRRGGFEERDHRPPAPSPGGARAGVRRIVYLGGLGDDEPISRSTCQPAADRRRAGRAGVPVTEFRAAVIIGSGSASFEMLRHLAERLPVMITPALGGHPLPADRDQRRARLPGRRARPSRVTGHRRDRRPGRHHLRRDDADLRAPRGLRRL